MITEIHKYIRQLAKSDYYQSLFSLGKEHSNLNIFKNNMDFTEIQMLFLRFLNFYSSLYLDIALGDVDDIVLKDEIYEDSYMYFKNKKDKLKTKDINISKDKQTIGTSRWVFKKSPVKNSTK